MASGPVDPEVLLRLKGERGNRGNQGLMGHKGYQGQVGPAGFPGEPGRPGPEGGNTGQGDDTFCFLLRKLFLRVFRVEKEMKELYYPGKSFISHQFSTHKQTGGKFRSDFENGSLEETFSHLPLRASVPSL